MPKPSKQNVTSGKVSKTPVTDDARFSVVHSDPRFALARRKDVKVSIDKRFQRMLEDDDFIHTTKVDRYGRRIESEKGKKEIKRYYRIKDSDEEDSEEDGNSDETKVKYDPARGEGIVDTSEEDSSNEDDQDIDGELEEAAEGGNIGPEDEIPTGDIYRRIAVVNLDWDNVRAVDLMATLSSFKPADGKVLSVKIYPSEFGKERLKREELEGPPRELFNGKDEEADESFSDVEEVNEKNIIKTDSGEEYDSTKLRQYQLERLRYYYAVVECDKKNTAKHIYDQCDGAEYEASANFFDLRFVPDETEFDDDPKDVCFAVPANYKPNEFVTDALQHSKVKLTWDQDDQARKNRTRKAFTAKEIEEIELRDYLASSDSDDEPEEDVKAKYRALLNLGGKIGGKDKNMPSGDLQITFTSGLMKDEDKKVNENPEETTIEKYARKEREKHKKRKEAYLAKKATGSTQENKGQGNKPDAEDLGFDDPFFLDEEIPNPKKEKKKKDKEAKKKEAAENVSKRAELELLMMDDEDQQEVANGKLKHFDMKQVIKAEKEKRLKRKRKSGRRAEDAEGVQEGFDFDVKDPRFAALYEEHEFAIDPTNPRYKQTTAMKKLMEEKRKRSKHGKSKGRDDEAKRKKQKSEPGDAGKDDIQRLVKSLKRKSGK